MSSDRGARNLPQISDEISAHSDEDIVELLLRTNDPPSIEKELESQKLPLQLQKEPAKRHVISENTDVISPSVPRLTVDPSSMEGKVQLPIKAPENTLSLFQHLPAEMITEIILHALGYYDGQPQYVTLDVRAGVWLSGRICSRWRAVSLSLTAIWSHIRIDRYPSFENFQSIFDACIERSGAHLLSIVICLDDYHEPGRIHCQAALEQAVVHCRRWKNLVLTMGTLLKFQGPLQPAKGNIPRLEYISVESFSSQGANPLTPSNFPLDILCDAPRLRGVELPSFTGMLSMQLPWSQLTRYKAKPHGLVNDLEILTRLSNLEECTLVGRSDRATPVTIPDISPLQLSHLRKLDIGETLILRHLLTPSLSELSVEINWASDLESLSPFIRRSSCSLSALTIRGPFAMGAGQSRLLRAANAVQPLDRQSRVQLSFD